MTISSLDQPRSSMTGGDGNDTFEFHRRDDDQQAMTVRKITDFTVGDRIVAATYEISYLKERWARRRALRHVRRHLPVGKAAAIDRCVSDSRKSTATS